MVTLLSIVVVEDNEDLRELTCEALRQDGHKATGLACAEELEDLAAGEPADVFLIDLNLPGEDGLSLSRRIRKVQPLVGIIIISARSDLQDKLIAYDSGADWYLPKPVPFEELSAALKSFARRRQAHKLERESASQKLTLSRQEFQGPTGAVKLTSTEVALLTALARAPAGRMETWQIAEMLGADADEMVKASISVRMTRLRKKLQDAGAEGIVIESMRNVGYQLLPSIEIN